MGGPTADRLGFPVLAGSGNGQTTPDRDIEIETTARDQ
jgi:hypothetical protein